MQIDPVLPLFVGTILTLALVGVLVRLAGQPLLIGYVISGFVLGPTVLKVITDVEIMSRLGAVGVVVLLFFIGMAIAPQRLRDNWRIAFIGTSLQIALTTGLVVVLGAFLDWPLPRSILLGFVMAMSSTAVVLKILEENKALKSLIGEDAVTITLVQDLAVIPMLIVLAAFAGQSVEILVIGKQFLGAILFVTLVAWLARSKTITLPFGAWIERDHEIQVLIAVAFCFGLSLLSAVFGLSTALGAFVAGMVLRAVRETEWVETSLSGFGVIFVALFFVSIGLLIDLEFVTNHWPEVMALAGIVIFANTLIVTLILRMLGRGWRHSLQVGAMLAQIGEFSFVLSAVGLQARIITEFSYQMTISVIVLSLLVSPAWILVIGNLVKKTKPVRR